jgi:transmembrane sensor
MQDEEVAQFIHQESFLNYCFKRNDEDVRYWEKWLAENPEHGLQVDAMRQLVILMAEESRGKVKQQHFSELQDKIAQAKSPQVTKTIRLWPRIAAAASILLAISAASYFLLHKQQPQQIAKNQIHDIAPGSNKAILTLANGQKISLTDARSGLVAQQSGMQIKKTANGKVVYVGGNIAPANNAEIAYNTITNPKGGASALIELPDGSKVMLDASSSIKYPVPFSKNERMVVMTGEVYFDPIHNIASPFRVSARNQITEDIGTQFNINAYDDEPVIKTTLVEGSIKVAANSKSVTLKPGQQSIVGVGQNIQLIKDADLEEALAWKNGVFVFNNENVVEIMKQVSRWYNADIEYQGDFKDQQY